MVHNHIVHKSIEYKYNIKVPIIIIANFFSRPSLKKKKKDKIKAITEIIGME